MPDNRLFYIDGNWLTYEQAHSLGYTLLPANTPTLYTYGNSPISVRQDRSDNTYYDSSNQTWVDDFYTLNLCKYVNTKSYYKGESKEDYRSYIDHSNATSATHILYESSIQSLQYLYNNYGITTYKCSNTIYGENNNVVVWYDSKTNLYFDDRDGRHCWVSSINDVQVTMYDSSSNQSKQIYEDEENNVFYINGSFVSRDEFYTNDNYGIIRDNILLFKDDTLYSAYYDYYSNEYTIPNITSVWLNKNDLLDLGYYFIEGVADIWQCETPLRLPWKSLQSQTV